MGFCYNLTPLFVFFFRLIVLPPYEERFTRYLAYITADKVRNRKIKNHIELLSVFLVQSLEPANYKNKLYIRLDTISISPLVYRKIFTDECYSSGYFPPTGTTG